MHTLYCYYTSRRHQCGQGKTHTLDMIVNLQEQQILQLEVKKFYIIRVSVFGVNLSKCSM